MCLKLQFLSCQDVVEFRSAMGRMALSSVPHLNFLKDCFPENLFLGLIFYSIFHVKEFNHILNPTSLIVRSKHRTRIRLGTDIIVCLPPSPFLGFDSYHKLPSLLLTKQKLLCVSLTAYTFLECGCLNES